VSDRTQIEYRICWAASSNSSFKGESDWARWDDAGADADAIEVALNKPEIDPGCTVAVPRGLGEAMDLSGFEWWIETREAGEADE
jgi:hypothetical protein